MPTASSATASPTRISSTFTRLAFVAISGLRAVTRRAHWLLARKKGFRWPASHTSSITTKQFLPSSFCLRWKDASSSSANPGCSPVRAAYKVVSFPVQCGCCPSVTHRMPSSKFCSISSSWHSDAASVVFPNPPAPARAVVIATGPLQVGTNKCSFRRSNSRGLWTNVSGRSGAMNGTRTPCAQGSFRHRSDSETVCFQLLRFQEDGVRLLQRVDLRGTWRLSAATFLSTLRIRGGKFGVDSAAFAHVPQFVQVLTTGDHEEPLYAAHAKRLAGHSHPERTLRKVTSWRRRGVGAQVYVACVRTVEAANSRFCFRPH